MADITMMVLQAVSEEKGQSPDELDSKIYDAIDPDALERVVESGSVSVQFDYSGCTVFIQSNDDVYVEVSDSGSSLT